MSDYPGEIVTVRVTDPVDENGVALTDLNAAAAISIFSSDQATTYVANQPMPWDPIAGKFSYAWATTGRDPGEYLAKLTVTPTGGTGGVEWTVLELLPLPVLPSTCGGPWVVPLSVSTLAPLDTFTQDMLGRAASEMLYNASGRQFGGVCVDIVSPDPTTGFAWSRLDDGSWFRSPTSHGIDMLGGCRSVELPGYPIVEVIGITVDGVALPPGSWNIVDDRYLIRSDGQAWPSTQRLDLAPGSVGSWSVEYSWGNPVPVGGQLAARVLVAELAKCPAFLNDPTCRLPKRLQSITREGMTAVILDPFKFLDEGKFGVYEIDLFIVSTNPHRLSRDARVLNVDLAASRPRRVR